MAADGDTGAESAGFTLGPWRVIPDRNSLVGPGGGRTLEPMGMRLLLLLARCAPQTVTRNQMVDTLWQGRVVTDDAVNKQISKVRAALTDARSGESLIETVPKLGVRLTVEPRQPEPIGRSALLLWVMAGAILLLGALTFWVSRPQRLELSEDTITSAPGAEFDPALSGDGAELAYIAKASPFAHAHLYARATDSDVPAQQWSPEDADAAAPAWAADGKLAYVLKRGPRCSILVRQTSGAVAPVSPCIGAEIGRLSWLTPRTLVVSDRPGLGQSYRLSLLDVGTGVIHPLTSPPAGDVGDIHPVAARDGSAVYFLRNPTVGSGGLYRVDVRNRAVQHLASDASGITGFALGPAGGLILSARRKSDGPALWLYRPTDEWQRLGPAIATDFSGSADGRSLVFSRVERQTVLWRLPLSGTQPGAALFPSTRSDWSPVIAPDGSSVAFLSNRSGSEEIWIFDLRNGRGRRLTNFGGPAIQDLAWSPDSGKLLTSVPRQGQFDLVEVDLAGGKARPITRTGFDERHGAFVGSDSIDFVRRTGTAYALRQMDRRTGTEATLTASVMRLVAATRSAHLVFTRPFQPGVWIAGSDGRNARRLTDFPDVTRMRDIAVSGDRIYAVKIDDGLGYLVEIDPQFGAHRTIRELPGIARPSGIAISGDSVIYARVLRLDADLYRLRLSE